MSKNKTRRHSVSKYPILATHMRAVFMVHMKLEEKDRLFERAEKLDVSASELVRNALRRCKYV
jgi:hypothetical protein